MRKQKNYSDSVFSIELDLKLKKIVKQIRKHSLRSAEYRRGVNRLLVEIQNSGQLSYPNQGSWAPEYYQYLRNQAISKTFEYVSKNLDKYDFNYAVMQWVNTILKSRFIDVLRQEKPFDTYSIDDPNQREIGQPEPEDNILEVSEKRQLCIENNPVFQEKYIRGIPEATVGKLIIMKYFEGKTFEDIASEFDIETHSTISGFLYKHIKKKGKILDALRMCLQEE